MRRSITAVVLLMTATALTAQVTDDPMDSLNSSEMMSEIMPLADQSLLLDVASYNGGLVAVGHRGHIVTSADMNSWTQQAVPTRSTLTSVYAIDDHIWAAGHDAVIVHSADGGASWENQYTDPSLNQPLLDIFFSDQQNGFAIGAYGYVLTTSDGGMNWEDAPLEIVEDSAAEVDELGEDEVSDDDNLVDGDEDDESANYDFGDYEDEYNDFHLNAMAQMSDGTLYIAGETGNGLISTDQGQTWEKISLPYGGSMFGVLVIGDNSLITFGLRGNVFRSDDAGRTWEKLDTGVNDTMIGGISNPDGSIILVGNNGRVLISDQAITQFRSVVIDAAGDISGVIRKAVNQYLLIGENGVIHHG